MIGRVKVILSLAGLVFAVVGIARDDRLMVWAAIVLLSASVLLRLVLRRGRGAGEVPDDNEDPST